MGGSEKCYLLPLSSSRAQWGFQRPVSTTAQWQLAEQAQQQPARLSIPLRQTSWDSKCLVSRSRSSGCPVLAQFLPPPPPMGKINPR